jgi:hypothetical protein
MAMSLSAEFSRALRPALLAGMLALVAAGVGGRGIPLAAAAVSASELKAAYLYSFANFVQWPGPIDSALVIGVAGDDAFAQIVADAARGRNVNGRQFATRRLRSGDDPSGCQMLYVGVTMRTREAAELIERVRGPVLTVGETAQFLRDGGMVQFYIDKNRMRFHINQKNAEAAGLKVSSQLLALAAR